MAHCGVACDERHEWGRGLSTNFDKLFTGIAIAPLAAGTYDDLMRDAGRGCEDIGVDDMRDGDYGRLLDRAYARAKVGEVLASPTGCEPDGNCFYPDLSRRLKGV